MLAATMALLTTDFASFIAVPPLGSIIWVGVASRPVNAVKQRPVAY
jgi:hypothetical protein